MTTRRLVVEAGAAKEIVEATSWYEEEDPDSAPALAREVRRIFEALVQQPPTRSLVAPGIAPELGVRRVLTQTFPYAVILLEADDAVHVIAFAHLRKKPGYWHGRLRRLGVRLRSKKR